MFDEDRRLSRLGGGCVSADAWSDVSEIIERCWKTEELKKRSWGEAQERRSWVQVWKPVHVRASLLSTLSSD